MSDLNLIFTLQSVVSLEEISDEIPCKVSSHSESVCDNYLHCANKSEDSRCSV